MRRVGRRTPFLAFLIAALLVGTASAALAGERAPAGKGRFIVTLVDKADARAVAAEYRGKGTSVDYVYSAALNGFAGSMSEAAVSGLLRDARVKRVERDGVASIVATQSSPPWGLDRIDQRTGLDKRYTYVSTGRGVHAYILDTGMRLTHTDYSGRVGNGYDFVSNDSNASDCHGHGTHVAGTVGGTTYGVAKGVTLHPVRVLDCNGSGTWSGVIAGVDWVTKNHSKPAVANMSLGGGANQSLDDAVRRSIATGVSYAIAAGNSGANACNATPARVAEALTVGATDSRDSRTSWSNYGSCVDLFAPGASITSAYYSSDTSTTSMSGTSMASPHVAGAVARYLETNSSASPSTVAAAINGSATTGVVKSAGSGSPNRLLFTSDGDSGDTAPDPEPTPPDTPDSGTFTLQARGYKVKGSHTVDLIWSGASASSVDVYRNNRKVATTANDGAHTDRPGGKGSGSYSYKLCNAGTTTCSNSVTVSL